MGLSHAITQSLVALAVHVTVSRCIPVMDDLTIADLSASLPPPFCSQVPLFYPGLSKEQQSEPLEGPDYVHEVLKAILVVDGSATYSCFDSNIHPEWHLLDLTADLYNVGELIQRDPNFANQFVSQPIDTAQYTSGLVIGQYSISDESDPVPKLLHNSQVFFDPDSHLTLRKLRQRPGPHQPQDGEVQDRDWNLWKMNYDPSGKAISRVYEVKTAGGLLSGDCSLENVGPREFRVPYRSQLWVFGDPHIQGISDDEVLLRNLCPRRRRMSSLDGWA